MCGRRRHQLGHESNGNGKLNRVQSLDALDTGQTLTFSAHIERCVCKSHTRPLPAPTLAKTYHAGQYRPEKWQAPYTNQTSSTQHVCKTTYLLDLYPLNILHRYDSRTSWTAGIVKVSLFLVVHTCLTIASSILCTDMSEERGGQLV